MNQETENYLRHLRGQLNDLHTTRNILDRLQGEITEYENNFFVVRQERQETESNKEDNIKAHSKVLDDLKSENARTLVVLREKQASLNSLSQHLQIKQQELKQSNLQAFAQQRILDTCERGFNVINDQINTLTIQRANTETESSELLEKIGDVKEYNARAASRISEQRNKVIQKEKAILLLEKRKEDLAQALSARIQVSRNLTFKSDRNEHEIKKLRESLDNQARMVKESKEKASCINSEISGLEEKLSTEIREGCEFEGWVKR